MIDAFEVGVGLMMTTNVINTLTKVIEQFEKIQSAATKTNDTIGRMTSGLTGMASAGKAAADAWTAAAAAMERAAGATQRAGGGSGGGGPAFFAPGPRSPQGAIRYEEQLRLAYSGGGGGGGGPLGPFGPGGGFGGGGSPGDPGGGASRMPSLPSAAKFFAAFEAYRLGKEAITGDFDVGQTLTNLQMQGFSPAEVQQAYEAAVSTQQNVRGSTLPGNLGLIGMLMAILQRPGQAMQALPDFAKLGQVLGSFGHGDAGTALFAAIRAGEFRGVLTTKNPQTGEDELSPDRLAHFVREVAATDIVSHGSIGPAQILQFLRGGGVNAAMIDDETLFASQMALQMALGSQAGTALQGFGMQFSGGKMSQASANLLSLMGLIKDPSKVISLPIGNEMMMPGALDPGVMNMIRDNPQDFIMKVLLPHMQAFLSGQSGVDPDKVALFGGRKATQELRDAVKRMTGEDYRNASPERRQQMELAFSQTIASRIPGGKEIAETIRNWMLIGRDREAIQKQLTGIDAFTTLDLNSPRQASNAADAAWGAMGIAFARLAEPAIVSGLNAGTSFANSLANFANSLNRKVGDPLGDVLTHPMDNGTMISPLQAWVMQKLDEWFGKGSIPVTVTNGRSIAEGVTEHQSREMNTPQATPGGWDVTAVPYGIGMP